MQVGNIGAHEIVPNLEVVGITKKGSLDLPCPWQRKAPEVVILDVVD